MEIIHIVFAIFLTRVLAGIRDGIAISERKTRGSELFSIGMSLGVKIALFKLAYGDQWSLLLILSSILLDIVILITKGDKYLIALEWGIFVIFLAITDIKLITYYCSIAFFASHSRCAIINAIHEYNYNENPVELQNTKSIIFQISQEQRVKLAILFGTLYLITNLF